MDTTERRLRFLELLSFRRSDTIQNFADEFSVSRDTIERDILYLQKDYPILTTRGRGGGVSFPKGYYINRRRLTPEQANAIRQILSIAPTEICQTLKSILSDFA